MNKFADRYDITTEFVAAQGERVDVAALANSKSPWWNGTVSAVNDSWIRLGVLDGDFHWHKHDQTDEFFYVVEGHLDIELEDRMISLDPGQAFTVPKGVMHFPHARGRTVVLMVEKEGVVPTGD